MATQGDDTYTYTSTTPPASIYLEESDEESDRELRRSKRRPKRYESDEDYVLDSDEDSPTQNTTFLYNDVDESKWIPFIPCVMYFVRLFDFFSVFYAVTLTYFRYVPSIYSHLE